MSEFPAPGPAEGVQTSAHPQVVCGVEAVCLRARIGDEARLIQLLSQLHDALACQWLQSNSSNKILHAHMQVQNISCWISCVELTQSTVQPELVKPSRKVGGAAAAVHQAYAARVLPSFACLAWPAGGAGIVAAHAPQSACTGTRQGNQRPLWVWLVSEAWWINMATGQAAV